MIKPTRWGKSQLHYFTSIQPNENEPVPFCLFHPFSLSADVMWLDWSKPHTHHTHISIILQLTLVWYESYPPTANFHVAFSTRLASSAHMHHRAYFPASAYCCAQSSMQNAITSLSLYRIRGGRVLDWLRVWYMHLVRASHGISKNCNLQSKDAELMKLCSLFEIIFPSTTPLQ